MVGVQGFEPWTPCSQSRCATRLRYTPTEPIFYTEKALRGKYCKMQCMSASFLSKNSKRFRGLIALSFLLASLIGTHWIGFTHNIAHSGIHSDSAELSYQDHSSDVEHGSASCHLLDALTLAGFIASDVSIFTSNKPVSQALNTSDQSWSERIHVGLYQSRAPPSFIL